MQIEYALAAVAAGAPSVGIKASNGVVLATEKKHKSILYDYESMHKVQMVSDHIGMVYSGKPLFIRILEERYTRFNEKKHILRSPRVCHCNLYFLFLGMGPDYRLLVGKARKIAQEYLLSYGEEIPTSQLVQKVANVSKQCILN